MITIFTPAYNRASYLPILYNSLINQSCMEFEWVIVDDGSVDDTEQVVANFIIENKIKINYTIQENHGKHTAINRGLTLAEGKYFFIVDSDDYLPHNSVENVFKWLDTIENDSSFVGVAGCRGFHNDEVIGTTFEGDYLDCTSLERAKYNITGDKAEIFKTCVLKNYPFPVFEGENFISENVVWHSIAKDGLKLRWFNDIIYHCEYLEGGLTNSRGASFNNFQGYIESIKVDSRCKEISRKRKIKDVVLCSVYAKKKSYSYSTLAKQLESSTFRIWLYANIGLLIYSRLGGSVKGDVK